MPISPEQIKQLSPQKKQALLDLLKSGDGANDAQILQQANALVTQTSPLELSPERQRSLGRLQELKGTPFDTLETLRLRDLQETRQKQAEAGIIQDVSLPGGSKLGFAQEQGEGFRQVISQEFGIPPEEVVLTTDPVTGKTAFVNPVENRVQAIEAPFKFVGETLPIAGEVAGLAFGPGKFKTPLGIAGKEGFGSGLGASFGEAARLSIGNALGVNDLSIPEIISESAGLGAKVGAANVAFSGVSQVVGNIIDFVKGGIFTEEAARAAGLNAQEADAIIAEVNRILGDSGQRLRGTTASRTGDIQLEGAQASLETNPKFAALFRERATQDEAALVGAVDEAGIPFTRPPTTQAVGEPGFTITQAAQQQAARGPSAAKRVVTENQVSQQALLDGPLKSIPQAPAGKATRTGLSAEGDKAFTKAEDAWKQVESSGGFSEKANKFAIDLPVGKRTIDLERQLSESSREAITQSVARGKSGILRKGEVTEEAGQIVDTGGSLFSPADTVPRTVNLQDYNSAISSLKTDLRKIKKTTELGTPVSRDLSKAITALEADRNELLRAAGRGDMIPLIKSAEDATAEFRSTFDRSFVGKLLKKDESGVFNIKNDKVITDILRSKGDEAQLVADSLKARPEALTAIREGIIDDYKKSVFRKGNFSKDLADEYLVNNADTLKPFFTNEELRLAKTGNRFLDRVARQTKRLETILKDSKRFGAGKLGSLDPREITNWIAKSKGGLSFKNPDKGGINSRLSKVKWFTNNFRDRPEVLSAFREEFRNQIRKDIVDSSGKISFESLDSIIKNSSEVIKEAFGSQYLKDLRAIHSATSIIRRKGGPLKKDEMFRTLVQVARGSVAPPLTRQGRFLTASLMFSDKKSHDIIAKALLDPEALSAVAKTMESGQFGRKTMQALIGAGIIEADIGALQEIPSGQ